MIIVAEAGKLEPMHTILTGVPRSAPPRSIPESGGNVEGTWVSRSVRGHHHEGTKFRKNGKKANVTIRIPRDATAEAGHEGGVRIVLDGASGAGRISVVECVLAEGYALPFHVHHREDEVVHVEEGEVLVCLGGEERVLSTGDAMFLPRGVEHSFAALCGGARVFCTFTPAGFEEFMAEMDGVMASSSGVERLIAAAARYGCDITGEPPTIDFGDEIGGRA